MQEKIGTLICLDKLGTATLPIKHETGPQGKGETIKIIHAHCPLNMTSYKLEGTNYKQNPYQQQLKTLRCKLGRRANTRKNTKP